MDWTNSTVVSGALIGTGLALAGLFVSGGLAEIRRGMGVQFDPAMAEVFIAVRERAAA